MLKIENPFKTEDNMLGSRPLKYVFASELRGLSSRGRTDGGVLQPQVAPPGEVQQLVDDLSVGAPVGVHGRHRQQRGARLGPLQDLLREVGHAERPEAGHVVVDVQHVDGQPRWGRDKIGPQNTTQNREPIPKTPQD